MKISMQEKEKKKNNKIKWKSMRWWLFIRIATFRHVPFTKSLKSSLQINFIILQCTRIHKICLLQFFIGLCPSLFDSIMDVVYVEPFLTIKLKQINFWSPFSYCMLFFHHIFTFIFFSFFTDKFGCSVSHRKLFKPILKTGIEKGNIHS